jgi:hypothetical protein
MEYERQQREYWRAQEAKREEERIRQLNEQRRLDDERAVREANKKAGTIFDVPSAAPAPSVGGGNAAAAQAIEKARRDFEKQPKLPAERNRLLGRWKLDTAKPGPSNELMALLGAGSVCEMLWGTAAWEFQPAALRHVDAMGNMVIGAEYRGSSERVAVLPREFFRLLVFDFVGPDRVREVLTSGAGACEFVRMGTPAKDAGAATQRGQR